MTKELTIKIKKLHPNAKIPKYAKNGDAGMDLTAVAIEKISEEFNKYNFGIAMEIPEGYVGLIFPRSSIYKQMQLMTNSVAVIDSGYRGEISAIMLGDDEDVNYKIGDRIAQIVIMPYPKVKFIESLELTETDRGAGGFGSTGKSEYKV